MTVPASAPNGLPPFGQYVAAFDPPHHEAHPADDPDEPMSLPDLADLIRTTAEALDTLVEHTSLLRHRTEDSAHAIELHAIADDLGQAWGYTIRARDAAKDLAAVRP